MTAKHIIGIGGTGSKCVEAMVHLAACGLIPSATVSLFDQDQTNGNLVATRRLLDGYKDLIKGLGKKLSDIAPNTSLFQNEFTRPADAHEWCWHPLAQDGQRFSQMFRIHTLDDNLQHLARALFQNRFELEMDLTVGFKGRPAIGAAVIAGSRHQNHPFWDYVHSMMGNAKGDVSLFLVGSLFGGTGAAGLPTIAREAKRLYNEEAVTTHASTGLNVGVGMMLPYFTYVDPPPSASEDERSGIARAAELPLRSQLALDFYAQALDEYNGRGFFDAVYMLGMPHPIDLGYRSKGGSEQRNPALLLEIFAALAAGHFLENGINARGAVWRCGVGSNPNTGNPKVRWKDLPPVADHGARSSVLAKVGQMVRFAFAYYYVYHPYIFPSDSSQQNRNSKEQWYRQLLNKDGNRVSLNAIPEAEKLEQYCIRLLEWYAGIALTPRGRSWIDLASMMRADYAVLSESPGEEKTKAPMISLIQAPKRGDSETQKKLSDAFDNLLGVEKRGGLEIVYEGLSRQKPKEQGFAVFVHALWRACAMQPPGQIN